MFLKFLLEFSYKSGGSDPGPKRQFKKLCKDLSRKANTAKFHHLYCTQFVFENLSRKSGESHTPELWILSEMKTYLFLEIKFSILKNFLRCRRAPSSCPLGSAILAYAFGSPSKFLLHLGKWTKLSFPGRFGVIIR